jgi:hypothetical protein
MLINLSNHPSAAWPEHQMRLAKKLYDNVVDLPFPVVDPKAGEVETSNLADKLAAQCLNLLPKTGNHAVHVMGEMTLTFSIVCKLSSMGIKCVASTTDRNVYVAESKKITEFNFIRFREYIHPCD